MAYLSEGPQESLDTAEKIVADLACCLAAGAVNCAWAGNLLIRAKLSGRLRLCRQSSTGNAASDAQSDSQGAAYGFGSHPVYDGNSGAQPGALRRLPRIVELPPDCSGFNVEKTLRRNPRNSSRAGRRPWRYW